MPDEHVITIPAAAADVALSEPAIHQAIKRGALATYPLRTTRRGVKLSEVRAYAARTGKKPGRPKNTQPPGQPAKEEQP